MSIYHCLVAESGSCQSGLFLWTQNQFLEVLHSAKKLPCAVSSEERSYSEHLAVKSYFFLYEKDGSVWEVEDISCKQEPGEAN